VASNELRLSLCFNVSVYLLTALGGYNDALARQVFSSLASRTFNLILIMEVGTGAAAAKAMLLHGAYVEAVSGGHSQIVDSCRKMLHLSARGIREEKEKK